MELFMSIMRKLARSCDDQAQQKKLMSQNNETIQCPSLCQLPPPLLGRTGWP